jgi:hypothetical protein
MLPSVLYDKLYRGELEAFKMHEGGQWYILEAEINRYIGRGHERTDLPPGAISGAKGHGPLRDYSRLLTRREKGEVKRGRGRPSCSVKKEVQDEQNGRILKIGQALSRLREDWTNYQSYFRGIIYDILTDIKECYEGKGS